MPVENIVVGEKIITYEHESLSTAQIKHISIASTNTLIAITTNKGSFYAAPEQHFFDPVMQQWISAENVTTQSTFLDATLHHCGCCKVEIINVPTTKIYRITTTYPHAFFATEQELLTHNAFSVFIGLAWLFGEGLQFLGLTVGTTALGSYIGVQVYNAQKQKTQKCDIGFHVGPCGFPCPDPDDDENKKRQFNTITKTEFFKTMKKHYEYYKEDIYRTKSDAFGKKTKYIKWDHLHDDIEVYNKCGKHLGSIDSKTLKFYKPANPRNWINV